MCEFKVLLDGEVVFEDVIYARVDGEKLVLKNVLGVSKVLEDCLIVEVNVAQEKLVLSRVKK